MGSHTEIQMSLTAENAVPYLRERGHLSANESVTACELTGGVSNVVVLVTRDEGEDLVLKQACKQLKVSVPWFCSVERIWREIDVLRQCEQLLRDRSPRPPLDVGVPRFLFDDRENYLYAMSAAPANHVVWKSDLLSGDVRLDVASSCGTLLGRLHAGSWHDDVIARQFDDRQYFNDLRLDPYYRQLAVVHPPLRPVIEQLIASGERNRHCLVHGDFSPKNLLVHENRLTLIDFEVGHYGDPGFDIGFFLAHLVLKAFYHSPRHEPLLEAIQSFWTSYHVEMAKVVSASKFKNVVGRGIQNFAGCTLARLDGKSRIDYLNDADRRDKVRELCRTIFTKQPQDWSDVQQLVRKLLTEQRVES